MRYWRKRRREVIGKLFYHQLRRRQQVAKWQRTRSRENPKMEMAATTVQPCPSSFIFFTQRQKTRLHNIIHSPFLPLPPPHLRRRFSSSAASDSNSRKRRRKWDSNAETIRAKDFTFNTQNNEDEDDEEEDYDGETASSGILEEAIDSIWILKVQVRKFIF